MLLEFFIGVLQCVELGLEGIALFIKLLLPALFSSVKLLFKFLDFMVLIMDFLMKLGDGLLKGSDLSFQNLNFRLELSDLLLVDGVRLLVALFQFDDFFLKFGDGNF